MEQIEETDHEWYENAIVALTDHMNATPEEEVDTTVGVSPHEEEPAQEDMPVVGITPAIVLDGITVSINELQAFANKDSTKTSIYRTPYSCPPLFTVVNNHGFADNVNGYAVPTQKLKDFLEHVKIPLAGVVQMEGGVCSGLTPNLLLINWDTVTAEQAKLWLNLYSDSLTPLVKHKLKQKCLKQYAVEVTFFVEAENEQEAKSKMIEHLDFDVLSKNFPAGEILDDAVKENI